MSFTSDPGEERAFEPDSESRDKRWQEHIVAAQQAYAQARFADAERACRAALEEAEGMGAGHPRIAAALNDLGEIFRAQGRYAEAEPLFRQSLAQSEEALGPWHLQVAHTLHNLAALCGGQEKSEEAERYYRRALEIGERILGPEDSSLAASLNNLALLYKTRGDFANAMPLFQRAMRLWLKDSPAGNPQAATAMNNMGAICYAQGKNEEAEALFKQALDMKEGTLGARHPEVATILNNLAEVYDAQGKFEQAEPLLWRLLDAEDSLLGPEHPNVATDLSWLGRIAETGADYARAESLYGKALAIRERHFGPESIQVADDLTKLAALCRRQGRREEANVFSQRAARIYQMAPGLVAAEPQPTAPPETTPAAGGRANEAFSTRRSSEGRETPAPITTGDRVPVDGQKEQPRSLKSLAISELPHELGSLPAAQSLCEMAERYAREGKLIEAEKLYEGALAIEEALPAKESAALPATLNNLGDVRRGLGRTEDAAWLFQRALAIGVNSLGPNHPYVATVLNNLAAVYADRQKFPEAETLCEQSLRLKETMPESSQREIIQANLAQLREAQKHP